MNSFNIFGKKKFKLSLHSRYLNNELKTVYMENRPELKKNFEEALPSDFVLEEEPETGKIFQQWVWRTGTKKLYCDVYTSLLDAPGSSPGTSIWVFNYNICVWYHRTLVKSHKLRQASKSIIAMLEDKYGIK